MTQSKFKKWKDGLKAEAEAKKLKASEEQEKLGL